MNNLQRRRESLPSILPRFCTETTTEQIRDADDDMKHPAELKSITTEVENASADLDEVRSTLNNLRKWHDWELRRRESMRKYLLSKVFPRRPPCPSHEKLKQLATFFFPPRASLTATICVYGEGKFNRSEFDICDIETRKSEAHWQCAYQPMK